MTRVLAMPKLLASGADGSWGRSALHTIWGLDAIQLHSRFWASRGIQVVRQGERSEIVPQAELFLLTDPRTMAIFRLIAIVEQISWLNAELMFVRLTDRRDRGYREFIMTDEEDHFVKFKRDYGGSDMRLARVALTPDREIAKLWQAAKDPRGGWQRLRYAIRPRDRWTMHARGRVYDRQSDVEGASFVRDLVTTGKRPDSTIHNIHEIAPRVWAPLETKADPRSRFVGPVWVGSGRQSPESTAVGPAVLWDSPEARPVPEDIRWLDLEPTAAPTFASIKKHQATPV